MTLLQAATAAAAKTGNFWDSFKGLSLDDALHKIANDLVNFGFRLLVALLVFYVGKFIINKIYRLSANVMNRRAVDASLMTFLLSLIKITLYFILIVTIIGILGVETSSFLALFASAGVAIGMALSGTLQNFAGGVLILLLKPYKVGDYIETQGYAGTVKAIQIFYTVINTVDNRAIIIPNGGLSTGTINNYSFESYRRVDWTVSLAYGTDYAAARQAILDMLMADPRVVKKYIEDDQRERARKLLDQVKQADEQDQVEAIAAKAGLSASMKRRSLWNRIFHRGKSETQQIQEQLKARIAASSSADNSAKTDRSPFVGLSEMADSSINLTVRAWTHSSTYWELFFAMNDKLYTQLPEKGFSFPFPQLDVHVNPS